MNDFVVVIPARGGSKRFLGKNIYPFNGKPLIAHSIEYAKKTLVGAPIIVSTDSPDIAKVAYEYDAEVLWRPDNLSGDYVTTAATLQQVGEELIKKNLNFNYMVLLQPTNPMRPVGMLEEAIETFKEDSYDSLMTVSLSDMKLGRIIDGVFIPWNYKYGQRSQDLEPLYYENGLLYITKKELILQGKIVGDKLYPMIVDHIFGTIDIDTIEDLYYAEFVTNKIKE